ncbi:O-antigen ligase family protein [Clostridium fallax]|uniref:O-Antigen ligase n=1 Tax=Clostridium fallax TaxID=1533 RepID=A0A1M4WQJ4_9CLOT|nr:O-antigen ligase family protein [Clostridium fallax]SHE83484.1 O-Antigen ligase [Clostridium fallax]SQB06275.1 O-antigen polymerase family [Clostridium fallax]
MNSIKNFFQDNFYFKICYLITSLIFVTIIGEVHVISSLLSKIMLLWSAASIIYIIYKGKENLKSTVNYLIFILLILQGISLVVTGISKSGIIALFINITIFFVIFDINLKKNIILKRMNNFIDLTTIILSTLSIASIILFFLKNNIKIGDNIYGYLSEKYFVGIFANENALGISAAICAILTLYIIIRNKNKYINILGIINIFIQGIIILNCNCSNGQLILLVFLWAIIFVYFRNWIFRVIYLIASFGGLGFIIHKIISSGKVESFLNGRYALWTTASKVIKNNLIFGVGEKNFLNKMIEAKTGELAGIEGGGTHNIFLQIAVISGILVLIAFIILVLYIIIKSILNNDKVVKERKRVLNSIILSLLIAILASNFFEANLLFIVSFIPIIFWSLLGYIYKFLE